MRRGFRLNLTKNLGESLSKNLSKISHNDAFSQNFKQNLQNANFKLHLVKVATQGKGAVISHAFRLVEADIFVMVDADLQYDLSMLPQALAHFRAERLDMLNIARAPVDSSVHRKGHGFGNVAFSKAIRMLFSRGFEDLFSGYRVFSQAFAKSFPAQSVGFEIETELSVYALQCDLRVGEIFAPYRSRLEGSFSKLHTFKDGFKILFMILWLLLSERPLLVFSALSGFCFAISLILGLPIVVEFTQTSQVVRFPTLFVSVGLMSISVMLGICGILAHLIVASRKELRRFAYISNSKRK